VATRAIYGSVFTAHAWKRLFMRF